MALSNDWIERIHTRLLARYGILWIRMWEGIDPEAVKEDWAQELDGASATGIQYALNHLPQDRPPNAAQFRALMSNRPESTPLALPLPPASPAVVAAALGSVNVQRRDKKQWIADLRDIEKSGDKRLTITQKTMWREASICSSYKNQDEA